MTTVLLYFATAALCVWLVHRFIRPVSRRAGAALILLPLLFTGRALFTGAVYAPIDLPYLTNPLRAMREAQGITRFHNGMLSDVYCLNIPWKYATRVAYQSGNWALWNPFSFCGDILAASAQPTPYEPVFLLSLLLPMANSLTFLAVMTLFLAGVLAFAFFRELRCSELASIVGATAWMFATYIVFWLEWVITPTTIWLPLVLLGVRRVVRQRDLASAALLTVAFVEMLLSGHPESALHIVTLGILWAALELWAVRGRGIVRAALLGVGAGVVALLLTAIYMLPILEAIPQSSEHVFRNNVFAVQKRSVPAARAVARLKAHFVPFVFGAPHREWPKDPPFLPLPESSSCGSAALAVALFGVWRSRWRGRWVAATMVVVGLICGIELGPFADWLAKLPLYDIALNSRLAVVAAFGIAMLVALGIDALRDEREATRLATVAVVVTAALALLVWREWDAMRAWPLTEDFLRNATAILLLPPLGIAMVAASARRRLAVVAGAVLVLIAAQRTIDLADFYPTLPAKAFYPRIPLFEALPKTDEPYRVTGFAYALIPNTATMYRLEDVRGYQAMTFQPMREAQPFWSVQQPVWWNRIDDLRAPYISMMNVRYAVAESPYSPPEGWRQVASQPGAVLFENLKPLPRAFVPRRIGLSANPPASFPGLFQAKDFSQWSFVQVPGEPGREIDNGPGAVSTRRRGTNGFDLHARLDAPSWIVVSEMAWKGWRAWVDGKPAKVRRANQAVIAVYAGQGEHDIRLQYLPRSFVVGRAISGATLFGIAVVAIVRRRRAAALSA